MKRLRFSIVSCIVAVLGAAGAGAQSLPDQQEMARRLRSNQEELRMYSWMSKYTFTIDGVQKRVGEYKVQYFINGTLQKTQVSGHVDKEKVVRANGKKLKKKEREAAYEFVMAVKSQLDGYLNPLFAERAVATATVMTSGDTLVLQSSDVVTTGDSVEIRLARSNLHPMTASIATTVDGSPVSLELEFATIDLGLHYPARTLTKATWEEFAVEIATENSGYERIR